MKFPELTLTQVYTAIVVLISALFLMTTLLFLILHYIIAIIKKEHFETMSKLDALGVKWNKDGDQYFVYSNSFTNLQESDCTEYAFGNSLKEAAEVYCEANGLKL